MSNLFPPPLKLTLEETPLTYKFTLKHHDKTLGYTTGTTHRTRNEVPYDFRFASELDTICGCRRLPTNILHMDTMLIDRSLLKTISSEIDTRNLGVMLGCLGLRWGYDRGLNKVEFLAIDDDDFQHKRLVRHWRRLGLKEVRYVGDEVKDVPDRLVWGGRGMLMEGDTAGLLEKWKGVWEVDE
ncbi:hypothetical protein TL16_g12856 [Triparma laevis f. inornata]|uniref:Uncharacterized protein n=2 Tax=Triparma laevis TaxID=1534972 RepID=A0A9W7E8Q0_9STRA|nr:hypothetical protein TrLO_g2002 [Triparma laevis f. longispina]GMH94258.1 hypothetical protein TL16_g12856 [Triparma laevis f. inornata]